MSTSKGLVIGDEEMMNAWKQARAGGDFGFMQVAIDLDKQKFQLVQNAKTKGSTDADWKAMQDVLQEKSHTFFIVKDPMTVDADNEKFVVVHWGPDLSPVKQRMVYASSRAALKSHLGASAFSQDYFISQKKECDPKKLVESRTLHHKIDFRSDAEVEKEEASMEAIPTAKSSSVMQRLPITVGDTTKTAVANWMAGKTPCVLISLGEDQTIHGKESSSARPNEIAAQLPEQEPRYLLFRHTRKRPATDDEKDEPDTKIVFGYYCPDKADRALKFTYSTCKVNVMDYCTSVGLEFEGKVEFTQAKEMTDEYLDYHVFPNFTKKEKFAKPKAGGGRGGKKKRKKLDV